MCVAKVLNCVPWAGSKRRAALKRPRRATCSRSSRSAAFAKRCARLRARGSHRCTSASSLAAPGVRLSLPTVFNVIFIAYPYDSRSPSLRRGAPLPAPIAAWPALPPPLPPAPPAFAFFCYPLLGTGGSFFSGFFLFVLGFVLFYYLTHCCGRESL